MKIVFTGGGTAGHISLNLALIPYFIEKGYEVHYIGSKNGMEKEIIKELRDVKYHEISTGKLRRYFSLENFNDPFKVISVADVAKDLHCNQNTANEIFRRKDFPAICIGKGKKVMYLAYIMWKITRKE